MLQKELEAVNIQTVYFLRNISIYTYEYDSFAYFTKREFSEASSQFEVQMTPKKLYFIGSVEGI